MPTLRELAANKNARPSAVTYIDQPGEAIAPCKVPARLVSMTDGETQKGNRVVTLEFDLLDKHAGKRIRRGYFDTPSALKFIQHDAQAFVWDLDIADPDLDVAKLDSLDYVWDQKEAWEGQIVTLQILYESEKYVDPDTADEKWRTKGDPAHNNGKDERQSKVFKVFYHPTVEAEAAEEAA